MTEPQVTRAFDVKPGEVFTIGDRHYIRIAFEMSEDLDGVGFYCWDVVGQCMEWVYETREHVTILRAVDEFDPQQLWQRASDFADVPEVDTSGMPDFSDPKGFAGFEFMGGDD
jgi:hypothetical protein